MLGGGGTEWGSRQTFGGKKLADFQKELPGLLMGKKDGEGGQGTVAGRQGPLESVGGREVRWGLLIWLGVGVL